MSAEATARAVETPAAEPKNLEFYRTRDDIVRAYAPQTDEERLLVLQIARAWYRLQKFYDLEADYLERGLTDLFTNDIERYRTLCRTVAEAERAWRHAVTMFERARARSKKSATNTVNSRSRRASFISGAQLAAADSSPRPRHSPPIRTTASIRTEPAAPGTSP